MNSNYKKIFSGSSIEVQRIEITLKDNGIVPIIKNESESSRLAGFATAAPEVIEVFVHIDEEEKALALMSGL